MITRLFFLLSFFFFIPYISFSQKKIKISFNPELNKEYRYKTKSLVKIDRENMLLHNTMSTIFSKEKKNYRNKSNIEVFEVFNDSELVFSLQKKLNRDSNRRQFLLMDFLENEKFEVVYDKDGNIIETWDTSRITNDRLAELLKNFNQTIDPFYLNKEFIVGEEFKISNTKITSDQKQSLTGKLIAIKDHKAIFKLSSTFYTAIRDRRRNITGKRKNNFEGIITVGLTSGIPHQYKFIFDNEGTSVIASSALENESFTQPEMYNRLSFYYEERKDDTAYLNPIFKSEDSLKTILKKELFKTKEAAISKMNTANFLFLNRSSHNYKRCHVISANLSLPKGESSFGFTLKNIKIYGENNALVLTQKTDSIRHGLRSFEDDFQYIIPISKYCDLKINHIEMETTLEGYYGDLKNIEITKKNEKRIGVYQLNKNEIEINNFYPFYIFKDIDGNLLPIESNKLHPFSQATRKKYNLTDLTAKEIFLYSNILENNKDGFNTLHFKEDVFKIYKITTDQNVKINKTFKILRELN